MGRKSDRYDASRKILPGFLQTGFAVAAVAAALTLLPPSPPAFAADPAPSAADQNCLGCHGAAGMEKKLADGDTLQLHVPGDGYVKSVHGANGCTSCHSDVDPAKHPPEKNDIASKRSFALAMTQVCRTCHADKFEQWESSIHAALVRNGNPAAPICTDCHNPHAVIKGAAATVEQAPCKNCHADIYTAYLGSMHAKARLHTKDSYAPICSGCHTAHAVKPIAAGIHGQGPEAACFGCHAGVLEAHQKWLPNAALHFEVVSCPACHAPTAQRKVDLMLIDAKGEAQGHRTNRRAAVRRQHQFGRQGHRCADALESDADAQSQRHRRQDRLARPPGRSHRPAGASTRGQGARRSAIAAPVIARDRRPSRA